MAVALVGTGQTIWATAAESTAKAAGLQSRTALSPATRQAQVVESTFMVAPCHHHRRRHGHRNQLVNNRLQKFCPTTTYPAPQLQTVPSSGTMQALAAAWASPRVTQPWSTVSSVGTQRSRAAGCSTATAARRWRTAHSAAIQRDSTAVESTASMVEEEALR